MNVTSTRRPKSQPYQPPAEFGRQALKLAEDLGKTKEDILRATDKGAKTLKRLMDGEGSLLFAFDVKRVLKEWGADVSTLPPLDEDGTEPMDEKLREGMELLKGIWELASEKRFQVELDRLRDVLRAHELVAEGTGEIPRRRG